LYWKQFDRLKVIVKGEKEQAPLTVGEYYATYAKYSLQKEVLKTCTLSAYWIHMCHESSY